MKKMPFLAIIAALSCLLQANLEAVPSFTKNLGMDCSTCHTAYPQLTLFGKTFIETGGDLLVQEDYGDCLSMTPYPLSGRMNLRFVDKRFGKDKTTSYARGDRQLKLRAFHELEAFLAGSVGDVYYFVEFEAEDEWCDDGRPGFDVRVPMGHVIYNMCDDFHIFAGYDTPFFMDGNDTVNHHKVLRRDWKAASYVPGTSQMVGVHGDRSNLHWMAAWHADDDLCEGEDPRNFSLRSFYDYCNHTFGAYLTYGKHYDSVKKRSTDKFVLYGVDAHLRYGNTNVMMLLGFRDEHDLKTDFDFSIEANKVYCITDRCLSRYLSFFMPIANVDVFKDRSKCSGTWVQGSAGVAFYLNPSVRIFPAIEGTIVSPSAYKHKELRAVIMADIGL